MIDIKDDYNPLKTIKSNISIAFDNENEAKLIYDSVLLEFGTAPDYRSKMTINLEKNKIIIIIESKDGTSFRASINSAIKWIMLSSEIANLTKNTS